MAFCQARKQIACCRPFQRGYIPSPKNRAINNGGTANHRSTACELPKNVTVFTTNRHHVFRERTSINNSRGCCLNRDVPRTAKNVAADFIRRDSDTSAMTEVEAAGCASPIEQRSSSWAQADENVLHRGRYERLERHTLELAVRGNCDQAL